MAIVVEELCKADAAAGLLIADHELGCLPIMLAANEAQKEKYLPKLASGEHLGAFALTEPSAGSDVARLRCRAKKDGDHYILNGTKTFITNGGVADVVTVYAVVDPGQSRVTRTPGCSSWKRGHRVFPSARKKTKWASAGRRPWSSFLRTAGCRRKTSWGRKERVLP